jgi:putative SOS response-associated peptidase YedK
MWIHLKNREPFAFAGLWHCWREPAAGNELYSFTIITTNANALLRPVHDQLPLFMTEQLGSSGLMGRFPLRITFLLGVLQPLPSELMKAHEVSTLVNSPQNDTAECIKPVSYGRMASQDRLF